MNLDQIEAFIYASLTGSFSKTGEILFLTQPSVSTKIKALEQQIGAPLFERTGKEVYLSKEGEEFLPYAQKIMSNLQYGISAIQKQHVNSPEEMSIAAVFSGVSYLLPRLLSEFHQHNPCIKPIIYTGHSDQVLKMIVENEVSLGIVRSLFHTGVESFPLMKDEMVLACHPDRPLATTETNELPIEEVAKVPFILFKHETLDWTLIHNAFAKADVTPNIMMEVDSIEGAKQMVLENMGISFLPYFSIAEELKAGSLYTADIHGFPTIQRNFDLIFNPDNLFNQATRKFMNFLKERFEP